MDNDNTQNQTRLERLKSGFEMRTVS